MSGSDPDKTMKAYVHMIDGSIREIRDVSGTNIFDALSREYERDYDFLVLNILLIEFGE